MKLDRSTLFFIFFLILLILLILWFVSTMNGACDKPKPIDDVIDSNVDQKPTEGNLNFDEQIDSEFTELPVIVESPKSSLCDDYDYYKDDCFYHDNTHNQSPHGDCSFYDQSSQYSPDQSPYYQKSSHDNYSSKKYDYDSEECDHKGYYSKGYGSKGYGSKGYGSKGYGSKGYGNHDK